MNNLEYAICDLVSMICDNEIPSILDINLPRNQRALVLWININYFSNKTIKNWVDTKTSIENFLKDKNIHQNLDFKIDQMEEGSKENIISAVIQIISIIAIFNEDHFENLINTIDYETKSILQTILKPMINGMKEEIMHTKGNQQNVDFKDTYVSNDIKETFRKLEQQDDMIKEKDFEIAELKERFTNKVKEFEKVNFAFLNKTKEFNEMITFKDETIKQLEDACQNKADKEDFQMILQKVNRLEKENRKLHESNLSKDLEIKDKLNEIEKMKLSEDFYQQKKKEFEEVIEQLKYYKDLVQKLKTEKEVNESKIKIFQMKQKSIQVLRKDLQTEIKEKEKLSSMVQNLEAKTINMKKKIEMEKEKVDFIKQSSITNFGKFIEDGKVFRELEQENVLLKSKIMTLQEIGSGQEDYPLCKSMANIGKFGNNFFQKKSKDKFKKNRYSISISEKSGEGTSNYVTTKEILLSDKENFKSEKGILPSEKEVVNKEKIEEKFNEDIKLLYSVFLEFTNKEAFSKSFFIPKKQKRKRNIFDKFTLTNVLNIK